MLTKYAARRSQVLRLPVSGADSSKTMSAFSPYHSCMTQQNNSAMQLGACMTFICLGTDVSLKADNSFVGLHSSKTACVAYSSTPSIHCFCSCIVVTVVSDCVEARAGAHLLHSVGLQLPRQAARHLHLVRHGISHQDWTGCNQLLLHVSTRG